MRHIALFALCTCLFGLAGCAGHSHYAGLQSRDIKSLSASDMEGIRAGRGMSLALAAELNGYPGPMHVLELAEGLELTQSQRTATQDLLQRMKAAASAAGEEFINAEREVDRMFANKVADPAKLAQGLERIALAQAKLRGAHLQAHLEQTRILTPEQVARYNKLRGYGQ